MEKYFQEWKQQKVRGFVLIVGSPGSRTVPHRIGTEMNEKVEDRELRH